MVAFKLLRVMVHLIAGLCTCAIVFPWIGLAGRDRLIKKWSIKLLAICGVQVVINHAADMPPAPRALMVSNHISWLDVFVINTYLPCRFVAKSEIRDWPLLGWLCEKSGTIFISRGSIRDVRRIFVDLVESIKAGEHVAFFPEGTTAPQGELLPFHANLFEAAIDAHVPVQPLCLRYLDNGGRLHAAADFVGDMTFAQSMIAILKASAVRAELTRLPIIQTHGAHRRELARATEQSIATGLGVTLKTASEIEGSRLESIHG